MQFRTVAGGAPSQVRLGRALAQTLALVAQDGDLDALLDAGAEPDLEIMQRLSELLNLGLIEYDTHLGG